MATQRPQLHVPYPENISGSVTLGQPLQAFRPCHVPAELMRDDKVQHCQTTGLGQPLPESRHGHVPAEVMRGDKVQLRQAIEAVQTAADLQGIAR